MYKCFFFSLMPRRKLRNYGEIDEWFIPCRLFARGFLHLLVTLLRQLGKSFPNHENRDVVAPIGSPANVEFPRRYIMHSWSGLGQRQLDQTDAPVYVIICANMTHHA